MERKTYYMILGVSSTESSAGIRAAYRDLAKKLHPDVAGEQATPAFQEVTQAYSVLSDPQLRRDYNNTLKRAAEGSDGSSMLRRSPAPRVREPVAILGHPETVRPSFEAMYDRFLRNFSGIAVPKSEHLEGLNFEILLTAEEAFYGCVVPVGVPVFRRCPRCGGSGHDWASACAYCKQRGMIEEEQLLQIPVPSMVRSGSIYEIPLRSLGIHNFFLRLHIYVEAGPG